MFKKLWGCRTKNSPTLWQGFMHCKYMNPLHSPRPMPKAVFVSLVCGKAKMNHIYSSRDIETAWSFRLSHFFCAIFYFSCLCSIPYCSIIFTYASSSACNASPFAQKDRANIEIQNSITVLKILMIPYIYTFLSKSSRNPCAVKYPTRNPAVFAIRSSTSGSLPVLNYSFNNCCISSSVQIE